MYLAKKKMWRKLHPQSTIEANGGRRQVGMQASHVLRLLFYVCFTLIFNLATRMSAWQLWHECAGGSNRLYKLTYSGHPCPSND